MPQGARPGLHSEFKGGAGTGTQEFRLPGQYFSQLFHAWSPHTISVYLFELILGVIRVCSGSQRQALGMCHLFNSSTSRGSFYSHLSPPLTTPSGSLRHPALFLCRLQEPFGQKSLLSYNLK